MTYCWPRSCYPYTPFPIDITITFKTIAISAQNSRVPTTHYRAITAGQPRNFRVSHVGTLFFSRERGNRLFRGDRLPSRIDQFQKFQQKKKKLTTSTAFSHTHRHTGNVLKASPRGPTRSMETIVSANGRRQTEERLENVPWEPWFHIPRHIARVGLLLWHRGSAINGVVGELKPRNHSDGVSLAGWLVGCLITDLLRKMAPLKRVGEMF